MKNLLSQRLVHRGLGALLLAAAVAGSSGCFLVVAGAAAGAGTVAYIRGELDASLPHDYESTARAADRAIDQLQFTKVSEQKDALSDVISTRTAQGTKIQILLKVAGQNQTKVQIRVGLFGDEAVSMQVLTKIQSDL